MENTLTLKTKGRINVILNDNDQKYGKRMKHRHDFLTDEEREKHYILDKVEKELETLVGMHEMKRFLKEVYAWLYINKCRKDQGLKVEKQVFHMIFKGNPGTGKTTFARLLGKLFNEMDVLSKGHLIEVERADLVGEYIGHTAQKTRDLVKKALGGILFIDEAYSLARGGEKDFGKEAIDTLVKSMEDHHQDFVLILAGYSREMDYFMSLNPGLPSRFPLTLEFPDYSIDELLEIGRRMASEREYIIAKDGEWQIRDYLKKVIETKDDTFSNARFMRNIIEKAIRSQAVRLLYDGNYSRKDLMMLTGADFEL
ncbi:stage V sporulation protein K [Anaerobacillus sp. MEB173]|uniref:stage V sporulation protein K n=1 Tax=Anaerobacillus sp. MEB173 TaxID=3383345 RepID=UPI003F92C6C8